MAYEYFELAIEAGPFEYLQPDGTWDTRMVDQPATMRTSHHGRATGAREVLDVGTLILSRSTWKYTTADGQVVNDPRMYFLNVASAIGLDPVHEMLQDGTHDSKYLLRRAIKA